MRNMPAAHDATNRSAFGNWLLERRGSLTIEQVAVKLKCDRGTYEKHELGSRTPRGALVQPSARLRAAIVGLYGPIPPEVDPRGATAPLEVRVAALEVLTAAQKEMLARLKVRIDTLSAPLDDPVADRDAAPSPSESKR